MSDPAPDIAALRAKCLAATQGAWTYSPESYDDNGELVPDPCIHIEAASTYITAFRERDAQFIAAANPAVVAWMCDRIDALEAVARECRLLHKLDVMRYPLCNSDLVGINAALSALTPAKAQGQQGEGES